MNIAPYIVVFVLVLLATNFFPKKMIIPPPVHKIHPALREPTDERVIWSFWNDDEQWPDLMKVCVKSWIMHNPTYVVNVLSMKTYSKFIDPASLPKMFDRLSFAHKSDVLRLALLKKFGGYWIDATMLLNKPLAGKWEPMDYDVGGYNADHFQSLFSNAIILENWFLAAPRGSPLIRDWYNEYVGSFDRFTQESYNANRKEYLSNLKRRGVNLQRLKYFRTKYFSMHCAFLAITHNKKYRIKYTDADMNSHTSRSPLAYNSDSWIPYLPCRSCLQNMLTSRKYSHLPAIKFNSNDRKQFDSELWSQLLRESTIGDIIF